jgi:hypothetical protein
MPIETLEEIRHSQEQIENFAGLARAAKIAVEVLEDAFRELADYPEEIGEAMHQLRRAATFVATDALNWAWISNPDFDPST